jgi:hypothetical protein
MNESGQADLRVLLVPVSLDSRHSRGLPGAAPILILPLGIPIEAGKHRW